MTRFFSVPASATPPLRAARGVMLAALLFALGGLNSAPAQTASTPPAPAAPTAAQLEWQRQHAEWQRRYSEWEKRYNKWVEEQTRLDDGFLLSIGVGPSPDRVNTHFTGGNVTDFPNEPPFPNVNFRGIGGAFDIRMGWLVENDPYLKDYWFGDDELHDQLYLTLDVLTRSSPYPQLRFVGNDTANSGTFFKPYYMLDLAVGVGMTYLIYPYRTSVSTTVGFGLLGIQGDSSSVRTQIGPAFNLRIGQEWPLRENWRSGFAINYGYIQSINPRQRRQSQVQSYQENYGSHLFSIQWLNSFTPPKYRRGIPPARPQQYNPNRPTP